MLSYTLVDFKEIVGKTPLHQLIGLVILIVVKYIPVGHLIFNEQKDFI